MTQTSIKPVITSVPELLMIWHPTKNASIPLETITTGSDRKVWWLGTCGHEWEQTINAQSRNTTCPYCIGTKLLSGFNDLSITHPKLVHFWDYEANNCEPEEILYRNKIVIHWKCSLDHRWEAPMESVRKAKEPCPYCGTRIVLTGFNDVASINPALLQEWDYSKNIALPSEIMANSVIAVSWICSKDHPYTTSPHNRARGRGCPICSGKQVLLGVNDAATIYPHLVNEWDESIPDNIPLTALTSGSSKKVHWVCKENHKFIETVPARGANGRKCPTCSGKRTLPGFNDIATTYPVVASEWHPTKNENLSPTQFVAGSHAKVWWLGVCGHEWQSTIYHRTGNGRGCSVCAGKRSVIGFNDALSVAPPHIIKEYDETKNGLLLSDFVRGSEKKVWWKCSKGHGWEANLRNRILLGTNCPHCSSNVSKAEKELSAHLLVLSPDLQSSVRNVITPFELDMYVPSQKVAIEYNGVHWHSSANKKMTRTYHYDKWKACKDKGIQLIQIWEDDWNRNPELVKRLLARKLGVSTERRVAAQKTDVVELAASEASPFLEKNHIQGYTTGSYCLGLRDKHTKELASILVLDGGVGTDGKTLNIVRYATSASVVGGFAKLLKHAEELYSPDRFIALSDNCMSDDDLYEDHGFTAVEELSPDHMYVTGNIRQPKTNYPLERFKNDPTLLWQEGLTDFELADLNGLKRIWDAGKTRWVLS